MAGDRRSHAPDLFRGIALSIVGAIVQAHGRRTANQQIDRRLLQQEETRCPRICKAVEPAAE